MFRQLLKPITFFIISFLFIVGGGLVAVASTQPPEQGAAIVITPPQAPPAQGDPQQGQYIFNITDADAQAVAEYLQSIPAVENEAEAPGRQQEAAETELETQAAPQEEIPETGGTTTSLLLLSGLLILLGLSSSVAGLLFYRRQH